LSFPAFSIAGFRYICALHASGLLTMKLLAISDIHNNLTCVRKLRSSEDNSFDAIIVAGDIGRYGAAGFFEIIETFNCPIFYVLGNWDDSPSKAKKPGKLRKLVHLNFEMLGTISITGISGDITIQNRARLSRVIKRSKYASQAMIVVSHYRLWRLQDDAPGLSLHIFGHTHRFAEKTSKGTTFLTVGALDRQITMRPAGKPNWSVKDCRNVNAGNYAIIEFDAGQRPNVRCVYLPHDYPDWTQAKGQRWNGIPWISEEKRWFRQTDPSLSRYQIITSRV
jgi:predicted phosphodiesterase